MLLRHVSSQGHQRTLLTTRCLALPTTKPIFRSDQQHLLHFSSFSHLHQKREQNSPNDFEDGIDENDEDYQDPQLHFHPSSSHSHIFEPSISTTATNNNNNNNINSHNFSATPKPKMNILHVNPNNNNNNKHHHNNHSSQGWKHCTIHQFCMNHVQLSPHDFHHLLHHLLLSSSSSSSLTSLSSSLQHNNSQKTFLQNNSQNVSSVTSVKQHQQHEEQDMILMMNTRVSWSLIIQMIQSCFLMNRIDLAQQMIRHVIFTREYQPLLHNVQYGALVDVMIRFTTSLSPISQVKTGEKSKKRVNPMKKVEKNDENDENVENVENERENKSEETDDESVKFELLNQILTVAQASPSVHSSGMSPVFQLLQCIVCEDKIVEWRNLNRLKKLIWYQTRDRSIQREISTIYHMRVLIWMRRWKLAGKQKCSTKRVVILYFLSCLKDEILSHGSSDNGGGGRLLKDSDAYHHQKMIVQILELLYYLREENESREWRELCHRCNISIHESAIVNMLSAGAKKRGFNYGLQFLKDCEVYFGMKPTVVMFNIVANQAKTVQQIQLLLDEMHRQDLAPNVGLFTLIIRRLIKLNRRDQAKMFYEQMQVHCGSEVLNSVDMLVLVSSFGPGPETEGIVASLRHRGLSALSSQKLVALLWDYSKSFRSWIFELAANPDINVLSPGYKDTVLFLLKRLERQDVTNYQRLNAIISAKQ